MKLYYSRLLFAFCMNWTANCLAEDVSSPAEKLDANKGSEFSWDVTIAMDLVSDVYILRGSEQKQAIDFIDVAVLLDIYYRGFFIQTNKYRYGSYVDGLELGYELAVNDEFEIYLISKEYFPAFSVRQAGSRFETDDEIEELQGITERKYVSSQGIRYMRYLDNAVYWLDVAADIFEGYHKGWVIDGFYSYILQYRNWDINLGAGASFFSSQMNSYYFSVKPKEALDSRPVYDAGAGYRFQLEAFAQRPISESWMFSGGVTISHFSSSIANSPLVKRRNATRAQVGVRYVF